MEQYEKLAELMLKRDAEGRGKTGRTDRSRGPRKAEAGFKRLFINLGKADGFYPGEVMQFVNRHVDGRQEIGHIDLLSKFSYIEVPEQDAQKVIRALDGTSYKGRSVRCNDADSRDGGASGRGSRGGRSSRVSPLRCASSVRRLVWPWLNVCLRVEDKVLKKALKGC